MATVTVLTAERTLELIGASLVSGVINEDGDLVLTTTDGNVVNLGNVKMHSQLDGLDSDDHPQYALADGSRGDFATTVQGVKADNARTNKQATVDVNGSDTDGIVETVTITDDATDTATWMDRLIFRFKENSGASPRKTTFINEYGELRSAPAKVNTTAARFFVKEQPTNPSASRDPDVPVVELMDNRTDRNTLWGLVGDGTMVVGQTRMAYTLVLGPADTVPADVLPGTIIYRTT